MVKCSNSDFQYETILLEYEKLSYVSKIYSRNLLQQLGSSFLIPGNPNISNPNEKYTTGTY